MKRILAPTNSEEYFTPYSKLESLYTESIDNVNPFLVGFRILGLHSVTNGNEDYIVNDCKDYELEWTRNWGCGKEQME